MKSFDWVKRSRATTKKEMNPVLYEEMTFSWKRKIGKIVLEHTIHEKTVLNFDHTQVWFTSPNKTTYTDKRSESVPITNVDGNH